MNKVLVITIVSIISCGTHKERTAQIQENEYDIIEKVNYGDNGVYYKTLS